MPRKRPLWRVARRDRRGASVVEMALVGPAALFLLIGLLVGALGVFRYNQVAALAHEGARWASVRGKDYDEQNGGAAVTAEDLYAEVVEPRAKGLKLDRLTCDLTWGEDRSTVSIKVEYRWLPEAFFGETTMSSTATALVVN